MGYVFSYTTRDLGHLMSRIVVKIGTSVLTNGGGHLASESLAPLATQLAQLHGEGHQVLVCSSGAVAAGKARVATPVGRDLAQTQMLAAVGQSLLMQHWDAHLRPFGIDVAQILLTRDLVERRNRFVNARDTLNVLLDHGIVPIVNENDAVATEEIEVGDNDNLSALVALLADADLLLLLTDQAGLFDADPRHDPDARLIPEVLRIDDTLRAQAGGIGTELARGGMTTKLEAADLARRAGIEVVIAAGHAPEVILRAVKGAPVGTRFPPLSNRMEARKRWIVAGRTRRGRIVVDAGAARALRERDSSLLPAGIVDVEGTFDRGDTIPVLDPDRREIGYGVSRYSSAELSLIRGRQSDRIADVLGYDHGPAAVHRRDFVLAGDDEDSPVASRGPEGAAR